MPQLYPHAAAPVAALADTVALLPTAPHPIRTALPGDRSAVIRMLRDAHEAGGLPFPFSAPHAAALFDKTLGANDQVCFILEKDGRPEGCFFAEAAPHPFGPFKIANEVVWWIRAEHRGRGAYSMLLALIAAYDAWAVERGCAYSGLGAMHTSARLGSIYQRCGYSPIEFHYVKSTAA